MKKITLIVIVLVLITTVMLAGCDAIFTTSGDGEKGSGNLETRQFNFTDFTEVDIGSAFSYEINRADNFSVSITADDNIFEHIQVEQDGKTLRIGLEPFLNFGSITLKADITMPRLNGLESSGATRGTVIGFNSGDNLDLEVSGASKVDFADINTGDIDGNISGASKLEGKITTGNIVLEITGAGDIYCELNAENVELEVSGASTVKFDGSGNDIIVDASGASRIKLGGYSVINADISMSGASSCNINVSDSLNFNLSGASKLEYSGQPTISSFEISGGSQINNVNGSE